MWFMDTLSVSVSDGVYENINAVLGCVNSFVYYCETNNCTSRIKQLLFDYFSHEHQDIVQSFETKLILAIKELSQPALPISPQAIMN